MRISLAALLFPILLTPAAQADERVIAVIPMFAQQIVLQQPTGWEVAYLYEDSGTSLAKFVPTDQTLFDWREMLSVEAYRDIATQSSYGPDAMLRAIQSEYAGHCAAPLTEEPLDPQFINAYPNAAMLLGCPALNGDFDGGAAGEELSGLFIVIRGREDFYVVHYAIRSPQPDPAHPPITAQNYRAYLELISPLLLCEPGDDLDTCVTRRHSLQSRPAAIPGGRESP